MKIINKDYNFSFLIDDSFDEIPHSEYRKYHIYDSSALHIFVKIDENGKIKSVSLNRDDVFKTSEERLELIELNIKNMKSMGFTFKEHDTINTKDGEKIDRYYSVHHRKQYVTYFTSIRDLLIAGSIEISVPHDKFDKYLEEIFTSIELI